MYKTKKLKAMMHGALQQSIALDEILDDYNDQWKLPDQEADKFEQTGSNFLQLFSGLHQAFEKDPWHTKVFNITIKCHMLGHCILNARYLHPHKSWCYSGEDLMGKIRVVCKSCVHGSKMQQTSSKILQKLALLKSLNGSLLDLKS